MQGAAESGDLGHGAISGGGDQALGASPVVAAVAGHVAGHEVLGEAPGAGDFADGQAIVKALPGAVGELVGVPVQDSANPVERVVLAAAMAEGAALDPAPHIIYTGQDSPSLRTWNGSRTGVVSGRRVASAVA